MGQVLHGSARTTEAVRRAIQHSQASLGPRRGLAPAAGCATIGGGAFTPAIAHALEALRRLALLGLRSACRIMLHGRALGRAAAIGHLAAARALRAGPATITDAATVTRAVASAAATRCSLRGL